MTDREYRWCTDAPAIYGGGMSRDRTPDPLIGSRIASRRKLLGYSVRHAADRAGMSHSTWSRIEAGRMSADNRFTLAKIAEALRCSTTDLIRTASGSPPQGQATSVGAADEVVTAVTEADLQFVSDRLPLRPIEWAEDELKLAADLRHRCEYDALTQRLPALIQTLHAIATRERDPRAIRGLVIAHDIACGVFRNHGQAGLATLAAERAQQAAEELDDPVLIGFAGWIRAHAATGTGFYRHALAVSDRATTILSARAGHHDHGLEMLGGLHLTAAFASFALGRKDSAVDRVREAESIAVRTGDSPALGLLFGPSNIRFWQIAMEADGDSPGRALTIAQQVNPEAVNTPNRQSSFYVDVARAMTHVGKQHDDNACRRILTAERLAPQRVRRSPIVAETVRTLLHRANRGPGWYELRGLAERVGLDLT